MSFIESKALRISEIKKMEKKELSLGKAEWYIGQLSEKFRIWFCQEKSRPPGAGSCSVSTRGGYASNSASAIWILRNPH